MKIIQNYFFSGILIVAPVGLSLYVAWVVVGLADKIDSTATAEIATSPKAENRMISMFKKLFFI